jgi:2-oxoglutarate ferredoxin oxidoreductase subunit alpha
MALYEHIFLARQDLSQAQVDVLAATATEIGVIAYGSTDAGMQEAYDKLAEQGVVVNYHRVRALPFSAATKQFIEAHRHVYVVENNQHGQMQELLCTDYPELAARLVAIHKCDGLPLTARWISEAIIAKER